VSGASTDEQLAELTELQTQFERIVPHNRALGLEVLGLGRGWSRLRLPYDRRLVGDPESGVLHGGAISTAMDAACGSAVFMGLARMTTIATLDLRIDYLKPATPPRDVVVLARCYKVTRSVAFVRGVAFHDHEDDPIATGTGSFMIGTRGRLPPEAGG
jgi:uncharacterized protein (TIGR00369 family)